jgi:hypothetical protein
MPRALLPSLLVLVLVPPLAARAESARSQRCDQQFCQFLEANKQRLTPAGSLERVYAQARKDHIVRQLRPKAGELLTGVAGVGACGLACVKRLQKTLTFAVRGVTAKVVGDAVYDLGAREPLARRQSLGEHAANLAELAGWMLPRVSPLMPAVAGAQLARAACEGAVDVHEGLCLARCELLAAARQAGIDPGLELYQGYRAELGELRTAHQARFDGAVARIREHRPLLAQARSWRARPCLLGKATALAQKTWYEEVLHRALETARAEKLELSIMDEVLGRMAR